MYLLKLDKIKRYHSLRWKLTLSLQLIIKLFITGTLYASLVLIFTTRDIHNCQSYTFLSLSLLQFPYNIFHHHNYVWCLSTIIWGIYECGIFFFSAERHSTHLPLKALLKINYIFQKWIRSKKIIIKKWTAFKVKIHRSKCM